MWRFVPSRASAGTSPGKSVPAAARATGSSTTSPATGTRTTNPDCPGSTATQATPLSPGDRISGFVGYALPEGVAPDLVLYSPEYDRFLPLADL